MKNVNGNMSNRALVKSALNRLNEKKTKGDPKVHTKLNQLQADKDVWNSDRLTDAFADFRSKYGDDVPLQTAVEHSEITRNSQKGFGLEIAREVMSDGELSKEEKRALIDLTGETKSGELSKLPHVEQGLLGALVALPDNESRTWAVENEKTQITKYEAEEYKKVPNSIQDWILAEGQKNVDLDKAKELGKDLVSSNITYDEMQWALTASTPMGLTEVSSEASSFLNGLADYGAPKQFWRAADSEHHAKEQDRFDEIRRARKAGEQPRPEGEYPQPHLEAWDAGQKMAMENIEAFPSVHGRKTNLERMTLGIMADELAKSYS